MVERFFLGERHRNKEQANEKGSDTSKHLGVGLRPKIKGVWQNRDWDNTQPTLLSRVKAQSKLYTEPQPEGWGYFASLKKQLRALLKRRFLSTFSKMSGLIINNPRL
jgi:hypothetical protein